MVVQRESTVISRRGDQKAVSCRRLVVVEDGQTVVADVVHGVGQSWHHVDV